MGIQDNMNDKQKLEYRQNNPLCLFCEYSYTAFFRTRCKKYDLACKPEAKNCICYSPTLEPIDKRSPK